MRNINGSVFTFTAEKRKFNRLTDVQIQSFNRLSIIDKENEFIITESTFKATKGNHVLYSTGVKFHFKIPQLPNSTKRELEKLFNQSLSTTPYYMTSGRHSNQFLKTYRIKMTTQQFENLQKNFPGDETLTCHALLWCSNNNGDAFKNGVFQREKFMRDFAVIQNNLHRLKELEEYFTNTLHHSFVYKLFLSKLKYSIFDYNLLKREFIFFAANALKEPNGEFKRNFRTIGEIYRYLFYKQYFLIDSEDDTSIRLISLLHKAVNDSHSVVDPNILLEELIEYNRIAPSNIPEFLKRINYSNEVEFKYFTKFIDVTIANPIHYSKIFSNENQLNNIPFYKAFIEAAERKTDYVFRELVKGKEFGYSIMLIVKYGSGKVSEWDSFLYSVDKQYNYYRKNERIKNFKSDRIIFDLIEYYEINANILKIVQHYYFKNFNWDERNKFLLLINKGKYDFSMPFEWNMELH